MGKPSDQKVPIGYHFDNCVPEDIEDTLVLYTHRILYFYFFFLKKKIKEGVLPCLLVQSETKVLTFLMEKLQNAT